ncbi:hypothetical protein [Sebaldella termitidis]|uniref:hypothetical protein n=1 Tax=Sebaldella termitidis TaxID=826 RepID=UPI003EBD5DE0
MLELSFLLGSFLVGLLILLKMKNSIYKYLILFVICILIVPTVLLIAAIRRVEYRKEFQEILKNKDTEFYIEKCVIDDRKILSEELIRVKPFVGNRKTPNSALEVKIENFQKNISIIVAKDSGLEKRLWIFYRGKLIGAIDGEKVYKIIYEGKCSNNLKYQEVPTNPY